MIFRTDATSLQILDNYDNEIHTIHKGGPDAEAWIRDLANRLRHAELKIEQDGTVIRFFDGGEEIYAFQIHNINKVEQLYHDLCDALEDED